MNLSDFIGASAEIDGKQINILYVGIEDKRVMFGYKKDGHIEMINSARCSFHVEYTNRPSLHGKTTFIGSSLVSAIWVDDEHKLIKDSKGKNLDATLTDLSLVIPKKG